MIEVAAGLVFRQGKLLITRRCADAHLGGLWEFPGGKREANETFEECLRRELREELAIEVRIGKPVCELMHQYPGKTVTLHFFRCDWQSGEPQLLGCDDARWVTAAELKDFDFPAADAQLIRQIESSPEFWASS